MHNKVCPSDLLYKMHNTLNASDNIFLSRLLFAFWSSRMDEEALLMLKLYFNINCLLWVVRLGPGLYWSLIINYKSCVYVWIVRTWAIVVDMFYVYLRFYCWTWWPRLDYCLQNIGEFVIINNMVDFMINCSMILDMTEQNEQTVAFLETLSRLKKLVDVTNNLALTCNFGLFWEWNTHLFTRGCLDSSLLNAKAMVSTSTIFTWQK